jgi:hypothetical protein
MADWVVEQVLGLADLEGRVVREAFLMVVQGDQEFQQLIWEEEGVAVLVFLLMEILELLQLGEQLFPVEAVAEMGLMEEMLI